MDDNLKNVKTKLLLENIIDNTNFKISDLNKERRKVKNKFNLVTPLTCLISLVTIFIEVFFLKGLFFHVPSLMFFLPFIVGPILALVIQDKVNKKNIKKIDYVLSMYKSKLAKYTNDYKEVCLKFNDSVKKTKKLEYSYTYEPTLLNYYVDNYQNLLVNEKKVNACVRSKKKKD